MSEDKRRPVLATYICGPLDGALRPLLSGEIPALSDWPPKKIEPVENTDRKRCYVLTSYLEKDRHIEAKYLYQLKGGSSD